MAGEYASVALHDNAAMGSARTCLARFAVHQTGESE